MNSFHPGDGKTRSILVPCARRRWLLAGVLLAHLAAPAVAAPATAARKSDNRGASAVQPAPVSVPGDAVLRYQVSGRASGLSYQADAKLRWHHDGDRYDAQWSVGLPLVGSREERSEGAVTASGLAPARYVEKWRSERIAYFDAAGGRISFSTGKPDVALQPGAQDRLSITMQLAGLLAAAPDRYPPGAQITIQVAGVRNADPWTWKVLPDETLRLTGQPMSTVKLQRLPRDEGDSRIELWLARTQQYLPVRLRITMANGDMADQQLTGVER